MNNITPKTPSFVFGYWRPWKANSDLFDSYLDYTKDASLAKYGADTVGSFINQASKEQVEAINHLGKAVGRGMNVLSNQISDVNNTLNFLNRNLDIQIEQQKLSNLLLQNIAELLRVPDSEKERQHSIELGIKFFVNAQKDSDLYADALEELLKAESLMKQDYFVLHRIGCIYLHVEKYINPVKAMDYFQRAAKYAIVESDVNAVKLANVLNNNFNILNPNLNNSEEQIGFLAAESYEKAAFCAYILGRFDDAVNLQIKALRLNSITKNRFLLSKYQARNGKINEAVENLDFCINEEPIYLVAGFKEIDLISKPEVLNLIRKKNDDIDNKIKQLIEKWKIIESIKANEIINNLIKLSKESYEIKIEEFEKYEQEGNLINSNILDLESEIDNLINEINVSIFMTFDKNRILSFTKELEVAKGLPFEKMKIVFENVRKVTENDKVKIGSIYEGGIVFYIDETGNYGLVCSDSDFEDAVWGGEGRIGADGNGIANGNGYENTEKIVELSSWFIEKKLFSSTRKPAPTAARICLESNYNGYSDWYLPTIDELELMYEFLHKSNIEYFSPGSYWSSTEYDEYAGLFSFDLGKFAFDGIKNSICKVRAVRLFRH